MYAILQVRGFHQFPDEKSTTFRQSEAVDPVQKRRSHLNQFVKGMFSSGQGVKDVPSRLTKLYWLMTLFLTKTFQQESPRRVENQLLQVDILASSFAAQGSQIWWF